MNTIVKFEHTSSSKKSPLLRGYSNGVALVISPGSLHAHGEMYPFGNTVGDLILPRSIQDELAGLASQGWFPYFVRVPAIGLGSVHVVIRENLTPSLVSNGRSPEGKGRQQ
jgi:hypothetical protein